MREILFRAKRRGDEIWVYGYYAYTYENFDNDEDNRIYEHATGKDHVIYRNTLGQYTGLTDKNGKKIFEGDIVKINNTYVRYVVYSEIRTCFGLLRRDSVFADEWMGTFGNVDSCNIEVIGNIYDNPELLEERK